ncbi:uncharacterized histidine-rich protein DDB_G0274557-like [Salmo trutta]|uniref:uncharacterized histidine-rich protein DDB_G0274557-like n=1 Tax=Salmo trutta TaxID=8032 RepID=UPI0011300C64|nr:uncharacterized histidine-rich protein DDB_G0274557-like [Salmo trutta]
MCHSQTQDNHVSSYHSHHYYHCKSYHSHHPSNHNYHSNHRCYYNYSSYHSHTVDRSSFDVPSSSSPQDNSFVEDPSLHLWPPLHFHTPSTAQQHPERER